MSDKELNLTELNDPQFPVPAEIGGNVAVTSLSRIYNWSRRSSIWPLLFGLACCAIEMIATASSRFDFSRFGMEVMRASPRQSDLMIVSGTVTKKMVVPIVRLYNQMPEHKYVLAMGACASGGGPFKEGYNVVSGIDKYVPVDVYVPGCPPTPQALIYGLIALQKKMDGQSLANKDEMPWYGVGPSEPTPIPVLGPDIIDPRQAELIRQQAQRAALGESAGVRELPERSMMEINAMRRGQTAVTQKPAAVATPAPAAPAEGGSDKPAALKREGPPGETRAERLKRRREAARARKRGELPSSAPAKAAAAKTAEAPAPAETPAEAVTEAAPAESGSDKPLSISREGPPGETREERLKRRREAARARKAAEKNQ